MRERTFLRMAGAGLLAVLLITASFVTLAPAAEAEAATPYSIYQFEFRNGMVLNGSTLNNDLSGNFEAPVFDTDFTIHVSCSAVFADGWSSTGEFPTEGIHDAGWEILNYTIERWKVQDGTHRFEQTCEETFSTTTSTVPPTTTTTSTVPPTTTTTSTVPPTTTTTSTVPPTTTTTSTVPPTTTTTSTVPPTTTTTSTVPPTTTTTSTVPPTTTTTSTVPPTTTTTSTVPPTTTTTSPELLGSVGDRVWLDVDGLGDQTSGEVGVAAVTVRLYDGQEDALLATTTTDADGIYLFDELPAGFYYVEFVLSSLPADHHVTVQDAFLETIDSDGDDMAGRTVVFNLPAGETDLSWDLGVFFQQVSPTTIVTTTTSIAPTTIVTTPETLPFTGFGQTGAGSLGIALLTFGGLVLLTIGRKEGDHAIPAEGSAQRIWEG